MPKLSRLRGFLFAALAANLLCLMQACETEFGAANSSTSLYFVADTLSFDTIFTAEPTATFSATLYNGSNQNILIDHVRLAGGDSSPFNVSINGQNATEVVGQRLASGDSLIIFVNVCLPQSAAQQPIETTDYIEATSGLCTVRIILSACGQNTVRVGNDKLNSAVWTSDMPYFITGNAEVAEGQTLEIAEGAKVYFAPNASLTIAGQLVARGACNNPVVFSSSRREKFYDDIPGQWQGISFLPSAKNNILEHTYISNAQMAIAADSAAELTLLACTVRDCAHAAIVAQGATIDLANCLIYNCGGPLLNVVGGSTSVLHCTLANYYQWDLRKQPTVLVEEERGRFGVESFVVENSIICGHMSDEVKIDSVESQSVEIKYSLVKLAKKTQEKDSCYYHNSVFETLRCFRDSEEKNFAPSEASAAIGAANPAAAALLPLDIFGHSRLSDEAPDMGAIEYVETSNDK